MPPPLLKWQVNIIEQYHVLNYDTNFIADEAQCSDRTVRKIRLDLELWGTPYPPKVRAVGRPRFFTKAEEDVGDV